VSVLDCEAIVKAAALRVRETRHFAVSDQDLEQEGWLALLEAQAAGRLPAETGPHRQGYATLRARGAMRDACRAARRFGDDKYGEAGKDLAACTEPGPFEKTYYREILALHDTHATDKMREALRRVLQGGYGEEVAEELGISPSAFSQRLKASVRLVSQLVEDNPAQVRKHCERQAHQAS